CFIAVSHGSTAEALVAERIITRPKIVSSSAVEAMSRNSVGTGLNTRPRETLAASPLGSAPVGRATCVIGATPLHPSLHRFGEAASPFGVPGELVEGCRGRGEQHGAPAISDLRRDLHDTLHDLSSVR